MFSFSFLIICPWSDFERGERNLPSCVFLLLLLHKKVGSLLTLSVQFIWFSVKRGEVANAGFKDNIQTQSLNQPIFWECLEFCILEKIRIFCGLGKCRRSPAFCFKWLTNLSCLCAWSRFGAQFFCFTRFKSLHPALRQISGSEFIFHQKQKATRLVCAL